MKIFFYITSSMERQSPSWHLMKALLEDVLNAGIEVHAAQRHYKTLNVPAFPPSILNHDLFSYTLVDSKAVNRKNLGKRYLEGILYAKRVAKVYRSVNDYDIVFVQSAPTSLYSLSVSKHFARNRKVLYNSQDMFPGSAIANGSMPKKWMQTIFYGLQKIAYRKADVITAISEDMKAKLIEQGVDKEKIKVIVNWYDDEEVYEIEWSENRFVEKYGLSEDKFYVQYAGTMGTNFNPEIVLEVADILKDYNDIEFQMIGQGVRKQKFENDAQERKLDNIVFYPLQPQDLVSDVYSACSVCLIPLKEGVIGNSVPSKAALLMACGRVIINSVDEGSDYGEMFEREKIGFSAGIYDAKKIAESILLLKNNPSVRKDYEKRAKVYGKEEYSKKSNTIKYIDLFKEMVK